MLPGNLDAPKRLIVPEHAELHEAHESVDARTFEAAKLATAALDVTDHAGIEGFDRVHALFG